MFSTKPKEGTKMASTIVNPDAGNVFYDTSGTATTASTQPKVNGGAAVHVGTNGFVDDIAPGFVVTIIPGVKNVSTHVSGIVTGSTFAYQAAENYVIRRVSTTLGGVSNTALLSGGSNSANLSRSIKSLSVIRGPLTATAIRSGAWIAYSGIWESDENTSANTGGTYAQSYLPTSSSSGIAGADGTGTDAAATPTAAIPGELTYQMGSGNKPFNDEYAAQYLW